MSGVNQVLADISQAVRDIDACVSPCTVVSQLCRAAALRSVSLSHTQQQQQQLSPAEGVIGRQAAAQLTAER